MLMHPRWDKRVIGEHRTTAHPTSTPTRRVTALRPCCGQRGPSGGCLPSCRRLASTDPFVPDIVIDESMPLHDYGVDARVLTTPGHTPGSISVLADSGELIAGDLIAGPFLGAVRHRPANPPFHHDRTLNLASLDAVLALDPAVGYVGHGGPLEPSRVRRWAKREHRRLARRRTTST